MYSTEKTLDGSQTKDKNVKTNAFLGWTRPDCYGSKSNVGRENTPSYLENAKEDMSNLTEINLIQFVKTLKVEHWYSEILKCYQRVYYLCKKKKNHFPSHLELDSEEMLYFEKEKPTHKSCICKAGEHPDSVITCQLACPPWLHFANSLLHVRNKAGSTQRRPLMPQEPQRRNISQRPTSPIQNQDLEGREPLSERPGFRGVPMLLFYTAVAGHFQFVGGKCYPWGYFLHQKPRQPSSPTFHLKWPPSPSSQRESILRFCRWKKAGTNNEDICSAGVFIPPPAHRCSGASLGTMSRTWCSTRLRSQTGTSSISYITTLPTSMCTKTLKT